MSSRKGKCPGCKTPKANHQFGSPAKNCPSPSEDTDVQTSSPDTVSDEPSTSVLLAAIRNLSSQMESLQMEHNDLKKRVTCPSPLLSSLLNNRHRILQTKTRPQQPQQGFHQQAVPTNSCRGPLRVSNFSDLLSTVSAFCSTSVPFANANVLPAQGNNNITYVVKGPRKRHIDSFDTWLQAWNVYEKLIMATQPARCAELDSIASKFNLLMANFAGCQFICSISTPVWPMQRSCSTTLGLVLTFWTQRSILPS